MPADDRRSYERLSAAHVTASIQPAAGGLFGRRRKPHACTVLDLTRTGAGILSTRGFDPMSGIRLTLTMPDGLHVRVNGTVRFTNPVDADHYRMGIHFDSEANSDETLRTLILMENRLLGTQLD